MKLNHILHQPATVEDRPPVIVAHGLFGSARNWSSLAKRMADRRRVIAVDMRNHGDSPHAPGNAYPDMAEDLADTIRDLAGGRAAVLGHSMGGKAAMTLALTDPDMVERLIVADIAPVAYSHSHAPYIAAMRAVDLSQVQRRADADRMLQDDIPDRALRAFILQSLALGGDGPRWKLNLEALAEDMPAILSFPDDLPHDAYGGPALFVRGAGSDYAAPDTHDRIRELFPAAEIETVEGAGHWLHVDKPEPFLAAVMAFLDR